MQKLFVLRSIQGTFLNRYFRFAETFGVQHTARAKQKCYNTGHLQVKKKTGGGYPVMGKIGALYFFEFFVVFLIMGHT